MPKSVKLYRCSRCNALNQASRIFDGIGYRIGELPKQATEQTNDALDVEKTQPVNYAIDYDDTFTKDPVLWSHVIQTFLPKGRRFYLVTARRETEENCDEINAMLDHWDCQMPIVFSELGSKLHAVERRGIKIDIWIDDDPEKLVRGH